MSVIPPGTHLGQYVPPNRRPDVGDDCVNEFEFVVHGVIIRAGQANGTVLSISTVDRGGEIARIRTVEGREYDVPVMWLRKGHGVMS